MTESVYTAAFFPAECKDCGAKFSLPTLSDFAYGSFIFCGEKGRAFAYLDAIGNPGWDEIRGLLLAISGLEKFEANADADRFQYAVARCADEVYGERLQVGWRCPECLSSSVTCYVDVISQHKEIPVVTFSKFKAMSVHEKIDLLTELWGD